MEKSSKRGKIPQQDWPSIITRYEAGETLASIARTYDCSPPAISYIVSRTRARGAASEAVEQNASVPAEPQLVKGPGPEASVNGMAAGESPHSRPAGGEHQVLGTPVREPRLIEQSADSPRPPERQLFPDEAQASAQLHARGVSPTEASSASRHGQNQPSSDAPGNGGASHSFGLSPQPPQNGEARRRLHLPSPQGNGGSQGADPAHGSLSAATPSLGPLGPGARAPERGSSWQQASDPGRTGSEASPLASSRASGPSAPHREKEATTFIDRALRERVEGDIAAFLAAFDAALADDTPESRTGLREATDRLLRAGARTRIELERLEARAPLPLRDKSSQAPPLFRR
ncbi:MAG TPA: hypothetical protein VGM07_11070 [Stellaceae bacterium]|jgi:hypothetical protein